MKNTIYLFVLATLLCIGGGKKQEPDNPCVAFHCENGGTCIDGHCVCINDFTGTRCEIAPDSCLHVNCGPHGSCSHGHCNCDANWTGSNCDQQITPVDSFLGNYHMVGTTTYIVLDSMGAIVDSVVALDDTITIMKTNDITLLTYRYPLHDLRYEDYWGDANHYNYLWLDNVSGFSLLGFKKTQLDSAYYQGEGGNFYTSTRGKKIQ